MTKINVQSHLTDVHYVHAHYVKNYHLGGGYSGGGGGYGGGGGGYGGGRGKLSTALDIIGR